MEGFRVKDRNGYPFFSYQTEMLILEIEFNIVRKSEKKDRRVWPDPAFVASQMLI